MIAQHQTDAPTSNNITNFTTGSAAKNNPIKVKSCPGEEAVTATFSITDSVAIFVQLSFFIKMQAVYALNLTGMHQFSLGKFVDILCSITKRQSLKPYLETG